MWRRVLLPWPTVLVAIVAAAIFLVLGGRSIPLVQDLVDSRMIFYSGALFGALAAHAGGIEGSTWEAWDASRDRYMRLIWVAMLVAGSGFAIAMVGLVHRPDPWSFACLSAFSWSTAMLTAVCLGRSWAAILPLGVTTAALLTGFRQERWWGFGFLVDSQDRDMSMLVSATALILGVSSYVVIGVGRPLIDRIGEIGRR